MVWWIIRHVKVKNRQKEIFQGHSLLTMMGCHTGSNSFVMLPEEHIAPNLEELRYLNTMCIKDRRSATNRGSVKLGTNWCNSWQNQCLVLNCIGCSDKVNPGAPNQDSTTTMLKINSVHRLIDPL
jgi:hypothetical protein